VHSVEASAGASSATPAREKAHAVTAKARGVKVDILNDASTATASKSIGAETRALAKDQTYVFQEI
jgi:hypothetical protein